MIPQNGAELISTTGDDEGTPDMQYINAIDGVGQESLNYGYDTDNQATPHAENAWMRIFLDMAKTHGNVKVLVTDYCSTPSNMDNSYAVNHTQFRLIPLLSTMKMRLLFPIWNRLKTSFILSIRTMSTPHNKHL